MEISQTLIDFVHAHSCEDVISLRLKNSGKNKRKFDFDIEFALLQIEARQKTRKKLPGFLEHQSFIFPTLLSAEQSSNEAVARFHASLVATSSSLLDLTAGLGIDDMTFASEGIVVTACEIDNIKCQALRHNADVMNVGDRITVLNDDSIEYIQHQKDNFDVVFADPARRNDSGGKVHALSDCQPDILSSMTDILNTAPRLLVKSSPLLDLSLIRNTVSYLQHIYVVCFKGECKEVLIDIQRDSYFTGVTVVDLDWDREISRFVTLLNDSDRSPKFTLCERRNPSCYKYLYEPNAGVMKTGAWNSLTDKFPELSKADQNTHIFLSDTLYDDFPGRVMQICFEPDKKALKALKNTKMNVVARNHPLTAPQISNKLSLTSGSNKYLYAFRYLNFPTLIIAESIR